LVGCQADDWLGRESAQPASAFAPRIGSPKRIDAHRPLRPVHPNDAAQARLFGKILRTELDELETLADAADARWKRRPPGMESELPSEALTRLRVRIKEVQLLLDALRARFPVTLTDTD
jgi:hypothetical protein